MCRDKGQGGVAYDCRVRHGFGMGVAGTYRFTDEPDVGLVLIRRTCFKRPLR